MTNFKEFWKNKADKKNISSGDMVVYHIFKTIAAKSENKEEVLKYYLSRGFAPGLPAQHRSHPYHALHLAAANVQWKLKLRNTIMDAPIMEFLQTNEEIELFSSLLKVAMNYGKM